MKTSLQCVLLTLAVFFTEARSLSATCLGGINHVCLYSPIDPAGSKGSQSLTLGFGVASEPSINASTGITTDPAEANANEILRVFVTKGLSLPVDFGLMLGTSPTGQFQQTGVHAQWTVFEGFQLPALTVRGSLLRSAWTDWSLDGNQGDSASNKGIRLESVDLRSWEMLASWGVFGILTPYAGLGVAEAVNERSLTRFSGLEIQVMPPFIRIGVESRSAFAKNQVMAKISLGL